uniref:WD_REPEATS_REGION domain-containing protein n=1 Tax=Mesocestoides corti TaxID=53468 RepID=A0A5K3FHF4_MESCO
MSKPTSSSNISKQSTTTSDSFVTCELPEDAFPFNNEPTLKLPLLLFPGGRPDQLVDRSAKPYIVMACYSRPYLPEPACGYPEPAGYSDEPGNGIVVPRTLGYHPTGPVDNYIEGHFMRITALPYHPTQPHLLTSASWNQYAKVWDTRTRCAPVHEIYGPHVCTPEGLDVEDTIILTASWRKRQCLEVTRVVVCVCVWGGREGEGFIRVARPGHFVENSNVSAQVHSVIGRKL